MVEQKVDLNNAVLVPMSGRETEIHEGHIQLINYAKKFGDPIVIVDQGFKKWVRYLASRDFKTKPDLEENVTAEVASIEKQGVKVFVNKPPAVNSRVMNNIHRSSVGLAQIYEKELMFKRYFRLAVATLVGRTLAKRRWQIVRNPPISVRGPEVLSFFQKSVSKLMGGSEVEIMPTIVKDPATKIRMQGSMAGIPKTMREHIVKFRDVVDNAKSHYEIGRNIKLEKELRLSYKQEPWRVGSIGVWEGGMIKGRLEVTTFVVANDSGGSILLEEVDYYA